jgi:hypothetical protein
MTVDRHGRMIGNALRTPVLLSLVADGPWLYGLSDDGRLIVVDASDPERPREVGATPILRKAAHRGLSRLLPRPRSWGHGSPVLTVAGGYLLVAYDGHSDGREAYAFDVSDPRHPVQLTGSTPVCGATSAVANATEDGVDFIVACPGRPLAVYRLARLEDRPPPTPAGGEPGTSPAQPRIVSPGAGAADQTSDDLPTPALAGDLGVLSPSPMSWMSSAFGLLTQRNCFYNLELTVEHDLTWESAVDLRLTALPTTGAELPAADAFSAWQLKVGEGDRTPDVAGDWSPGAARAAMAIGQSPRSTRLLVSGSDGSGEYLVEGVATEDTGTWYLLVEVPTRCGTDSVAYVWERS